MDVCHPTEIVPTMLLSLDTSATRDIILVDTNQHSISGVSKTDATQPVDFLSKTTPLPKTYHYMSKAGTEEEPPANSSSHKKQR